MTSCWREAATEPTAGGATLPHLRAHTGYTPPPPAHTHTRTRDPHTTHAHDGLHTRTHTVTLPHAYRTHAHVRLPHRYAHGTALHAAYPRVPTHYTHAHTPRRTARAHAHARTPFRPPNRLSGWWVGFSHSDLDPPSTVRPALPRTKHAKEKGDTAAIYLRSAKRTPHLLGLGSAWWTALYPLPHRLTIFEPPRCAHTVHAFSGGKPTPPKKTPAWLYRWTFSVRLLDGYNPADCTTGCTRDVGSALLPAVPELPPPSTLLRIYICYHV